MPAPDDFTGERFLPECTGEIWAEHWHRYVFAKQHVAGLDVLDAACGEGYGSAFLARTAGSVTGLDIDPETVIQARARYNVPILRFETGSVAAMPFPDASFDCVVSFETLEHLMEQEAMLAEIRRVLRPDGFAIISTPNRVEYSDKRNFQNEFHVRELYEREFHDLLARHFGAHRWYGQRLLFNSALWPLPGENDIDDAVGRWITVEEGDQKLPPPMYFIAIAGRTEALLPRTDARASLLADPDDAIYREYETTVARVRVLEQLVAERERIVVERDRQIALHDRNALRFEAVIAEREDQLLSQAARVETMERLIAERERVIVERDEQLRVTNLATIDSERVIAERDALLAATNARVADAERVISEREAQLNGANERFSTLERLMGERERIIVERDGQLDAATVRQRALELLVVERERIIVERDAQLAQLNTRLSDAGVLIGERERLIVERDAWLAATNERMALAERVIAEREAALAANRERIEVLDHELAASKGRLRLLEESALEQARRVDALTSESVELRMEIARRASWRWWLSIPLRRVRGTVPIKADYGKDDR